ncbi:DUF2254 domain-containing protein [Jeotgalibacillus aurantiacus]|uniref:DUF2254 domain-containing protein n=1 Tax=Jeotgalibacillus aurantiacus TaxID=2763266 RepID=UPI001D0AD211|nr:DUF2254 domain-containing protein [Jeotgalibacillus aurantiacus]
MEKWYVELRKKVWLIPSIYSILGLIIAAAAGVVDSQLNIESLPEIFYTENALAQSILTALLTALLTMTTFTFSTIMVVLSTYASQYSPKTIKNFITDSFTLRVLGVFMGGFIYSTLSLLFLRGSDQPVISGTVGVIIAIICLIFFAVFIHHVASHIQASRLIERLAKDADGVTDYYFELLQQKGISLEHEGENWDPEPSSFDIQAMDYGYLQFIDFDKLAKKAMEHGLKIEVNVPIGEFVHKATPLLTVYVTSERLPEVRGVNLGDCFLIGNERDVRQDPIFALQKMVEVALRAISPGINDPNTANDSIRHIGRLLGNLSQLPIRSILVVNKDNQGVVKFTLPSYKDILYRTFYQLRHYGKEDVSVLSALLEAIAFAAESAPKHHLEALGEIAQYVVEQAELGAMPDLDHHWLNQKIQAVERMTRL